jgi:multiple sugar transport system substrate-binding protein
MPNPPKDWAEMTSMCEDFAAKGELMIAWPGKNYGGMIFTGMPVAWANGGSWVSKDGKTAEINHPKTAEWFSHYQNLIKIGCVPENVDVWDWPDKQDAFLAGDIAMIGTGNFMINAVGDHSEKVDAGFTAFMGSDGSKNSAFIGGDLIAIPVTTGAKDAALEYIEYVLSEAGQIEVYTKNGGIPIRSDLFDGNPYLTDDHMVFANASTVGDVPYTTVYQELMDPWLVANQRIWAGEDVTTVLNEQNALMQKIIDAGH